MEKRNLLKQVIKLQSARFMLSCVLAVVSFAISMAFYQKLKVGILFFVVFLLIGAIQIPVSDLNERGLSKKRNLSYAYIVWIILLAFSTLALSQFCQNEGMPSQGVWITVLGTLLILALYFLLLGITLKFRSVFFIYWILFLFSCANHFVFQFRGSEIVPADLLSITTAGNVAADYSYHIPSPMFYAAVFAVAIFFASYALPPFVISKRKTSRICCFTAAAVCITAVLLGGMTATPLHWMKGGTVNNGFLLNFSLLLKNSLPVKPRNYSSENVDEIAKRYSKQEEFEERPDIIVIMEESYADFRIINSELDTDVPVTPFMDNLRENTLRGYTLSSVFGGGTPNSEYEFLTGNSLLFFPSGAIVYQQYIKSPVYSIAWYLKGAGYKTIAMHQYLSSSWMRDKTWPLLGFEECHFLEDFPQKEMLRYWGTDQEMFETIVSTYEKQKNQSEKPVFMFNVTIQNHGGYDCFKDGFQPTVHLEGRSREYPDVNEYLSCLQESDQAIQWLIEYFRQSNRNVIVLIYGDHFPRLEDAFFKEMHGGEFETLDETMLQYTVPFYIWTNYDSEPEEIDITSMNYLAGLLLTRAGIELPSYQKYLEDLRTTIPACNAFGYYSRSKGRFLEMDEATGEETNALQQYYEVVWNGVFDEKNRNQVFFRIS